MADETSAAHLYMTTTALAYAVTQAAIQPRPPFAMEDQPLLMQLGQACADAAAAFRQKSASSVSQPALFAAQQLVSTALAMFNLIGTSGSNGLGKGQVVAAVQAAVQAVRAL